MPKNKDSIKKLKETTIQLRGLEEKYRNLLENANDLIQSVDKNGKFIYVNKKWKEVLGYSDKEIKKLSLMDILRKDQITKCMKIFKQVCKGKSFENIETVFMTKKGKNVFVNGNANAYMEDRNFIVTIGIFRDVSEQKKAEEEILVHSKIIANMLEGVYLIRVKDGIIVYTNPMFEKMFGYGPGEMLGKHVSVVNAPTKKDPKETAREITAYINKHGMWKGEILNIKKDGTPFWCYASVSIIDHPEHGKVFVSVHTDITEKKKAEEELKKRIEELEKFHKISVGRELKMVELKKKIKELESKK